MADLQRRLAQAGFAKLDDPAGEYGPATRQAVAEFQLSRGLRADGVCGAQTWSALVEAGYRLGDRLLYRKVPMLRGDDVAELQRRLASLGFDPGRIDGIFGDTTARALADFQRNAGLTVDGIFGRATLAELVRLNHRQEVAELVTTVKERERLRRAPRSLQGRRVALGENGGLGLVTSSVARALRGRGAEVVTLNHPDDSQLAVEANNAMVEVYLGLTLAPEEPRCEACYYAGYRSESEGGKRLAQLLQEALAQALGVPSQGVRGMALPVLRETRMPAVVCELGPADAVVGQAASVATAVTDALGSWAQSWE
ncbi:MAG TPA: peptidoglycan-binding protein [Acidimicrobiales bacterium]|nr:peptidoglycan-binding protein [Acidimicrobiales bacterium]